MLRKAIATVISAAFVIAGLLHFPQLGMPHYLMFSDIQMAQITAGYDLTG